MFLCDKKCLLFLNPILDTYDKKLKTTKKCKGLFQLLNITFLSDELKVYLNFLNECTISKSDIFMFNFGLSWTLRYIYSRRK